MKAISTDSLSYRDVFGYRLSHTGEKRMNGGHGGGMEVMETKRIPFLTAFLIHKLSQGKSLKMEEEGSKEKHPLPLS